MEAEASDNWENEVMQVVEGRNVCSLYAAGRDLLERRGVRSTSRAGDVLVMPCPVMSVYEKPTERVLFDHRRDSNPFFHLMESIWMLAGRDDAAFLNTYVRDFGDRFAESGGIMHGAYGKRWRSWWEFDQLKIIVERLRRDANDRRVVLTMWNPDNDLWSQESWLADAGGDLSDYKEPNDLPCNTQIYPRIVDGRLDITVCCRSNDIIWGAYGANAVHFSFLQEYLAAAIGVQVGIMYQLSNNFHGYVPVLEKTAPVFLQHENPYLSDIRHMPMVTNPEHFLSDCEMFCEFPNDQMPYANEWFNTVAVPMAAAHRAIKERRDWPEALVLAGQVAAPDWRLGALRWLERRRK